MSLQVCSLVDGNYVPHSSENTFSQPIITIHDGSSITAVDQKLYLKRDDEHVYSEIRISILDNGSSGWTMKCADFGVVVPVDKDWEGKTDEMNLGSITINNDAPILFWIRVVSPSGIPVQNKTDISLIVNYKEEVVI